MTVHNEVYYKYDGHACIFRLLYFLCIYLELGLITTERIINDLFERGKNISTHRFLADQTAEQLATQMKVKKHPWNSVSNMLPTYDLILTFSEAETRADFWRS